MNRTPPRSPELSGALEPTEDAFTDYFFYIARQG
jgi:hypothetical protein